MASALSSPVASAIEVSATEARWFAPKGSPANAILVVDDTPENIDLPSKGRRFVDFMREMNTGIPWGRGNGWVVFSLSELLAVLPKDHALRPDLLTMFRELSEGLLAQQDADGALAGRRP